MARKQGSGFKMKRGPMKDLGSFFSSFGKQLVGGQKERGIFSEKGKAEAKEARKPKWKREHDTRKKEERKRFEEKEIDKVINFMGQEVNEYYKGMVLEIYQDGTYVKKYYE